MISIHIEAHPDRGDLRQQVVDAAAAIGLFPIPSIGAQMTFPPGAVMPDAKTFTADELARFEHYKGVQLTEADVNDALAKHAGVHALTETEIGDSPLPPAAPTVLDEPSVQKLTRQRGQPSPGKKRRTAAEVAEDDAADAADAVRTKQDAAAEVPQISTGEARVGPEDSPEVEAQDRADEAAETAATKTGLTHDDVRQAVGRYNKRFGMAASVKGIPAILGKGIHELGDEELAGAIQAIDFAVDNGPEVAAATTGDSAVVAPQEIISPAKRATKDEVIAVMLAYAKKFDGPDANPADPTSIPFLNQDAAKIFSLVCGEGVARLSQVPVEKYGAVIAGLQEAIAKDPFNRGGAK